MAETLGAVTKDGSQWCDYERDERDERRISVEWECVRLMCRHGSFE